MLALLMGREGVQQEPRDLLQGVGESNIMAMCLIYLLAGAFATVAKATGGSGCHGRPRPLLIPGWCLLPGSSSSLPSLPPPWVPPWAPSAPWHRWRFGVAHAAGIDPMLMAGTILSGAMFGDNLSIISDTTIAATRSQGCEMKDKFRENIRLPPPPPCW